MWTLCDTVRQSCQAILPYAKEVVVQATKFDSRISKIAHGASFALAGVSIVASSNSVTKDRLVTPLRWGLNLAGVAAICYGVYQITSGVYELATARHFPLHFATDAVNASQQERLMPCNERLQIAKQELSACPSAQAVWDSIANEGGFTVRCARADEHVPAGAMLWPAAREIVFSNKPINEPTPIVKQLLFELNNLKQSKNVLVLNNNACKGLMEQYVYDMESLEFTTAQATYNTSRNCVDQGFWPEYLIYHKKLFEDSSIIDKKGTFIGNGEKSGHADIYRLGWLQECKPEVYKALMERTLTKSKNEL